MSVFDARLLTALRTASVHLPATDLAGQLSAPLTTVQTRLDELRGAGFVIEERPGLGYRLLSSPDRLIADDLRARLGECPLARQILVFAETDSTNDLATQRGRQGAPSGLVIFAEHQTAGRGRFGRRWDSAPHRGLWFSLLLRPALPVAFWPRLTTWAAVSLASAIEEAAGVRAAIKWPNDLFAEGKKIAGILAESGTDAGGAPFAVVGIGVNVNHEPGEFPPELATKAGSLRTIAGRMIDRPALAATVLRELDRLLPLLASDFPRIIAEAARRSFLLGRWIQVRAGDGVVEGCAEQLDENGHLLLRTSDGSLRQLAAGEVTIIAE